MSASRGTEDNEISESGRKNKERGVADAGGDGGGDGGGATRMRITQERSYSGMSEGYPRVSQDSPVVRIVQELQRRESR